MESMKNRERQRCLASLFPNSRVINLCVFDGSKCEGSLESLKLALAGGALASTVLSVSFSV